MRPVLQSTAANHKGKKKEDRIIPDPPNRCNNVRFFFFKCYELYPSLRHTGMMLFFFCFFLTCLVSNKKF